MQEASPTAQVAAFTAKYSPEVAALARAILAKMRTRLQGAFQLVYDNHNALAVGFVSTERASDAMLSIAVCPRWVSPFFLRGAGLADPRGALKGSGNVARHVVVKAYANVADPAIRELMAAGPIDWPNGGRIVIKSISAKQRPRRQAAA
jgi:hypothetical protein